MSIAKGPLMAKKLDPSYWGNPPQTPTRNTSHVQPEQPMHPTQPTQPQAAQPQSWAADKLTLTFRNHRMDSNPLNPILKLHNLHQRKLTILKLLPRSIVVVSLRQLLPLSSLFF